MHDFGGGGTPGKLSELNKRMQNALPSPYNKNKIVCMVSYENIQGKATLVIYIEGFVYVDM